MENHQQPLGRKSKPADSKIKAESPQDRISGWRDDFEKLLNSDVTPNDSFVVQPVLATLEDTTEEFSFEVIVTLAKQPKPGKAKQVVQTAIGVASYGALGHVPPPRLPAT